MLEPLAEAAEDEPVFIEVDKNSDYIQYSQADPVTRAIDTKR